MCLILFAYNCIPTYRLILAANRDEFLNRPTATLTRWQNEEHIMAGRDLQAGGTWLGVSEQGKFGALTNFREPGGMAARSKSRGAVVADYLRSGYTIQQTVDKLENEQQDYGGYNVLLGDCSKLGYYSNRAQGFTEVQPGIYGLSNHLFDTPWPKVTRGKMLLNEAATSPDLHNELFRLLQDSRQPGDEELPDTGVGLVWERLLSTIFITSANYGTKSSAILAIRENGHTYFAERTYNHKQGNVLMENEISISYTIKI